MNKIILLLLPLLLISCGTKVTETKDLPAVVSSETKTSDKNIPTKPAHKAQRSTATVETKETTKELDAMFEEIAGSK